MLSDRPEITLDYENEEYTWLTPEEITSFDTVPDLKMGLDKLIRTR